MTITLTYDERVKRLNTFFQTGRIIRSEFVSRNDEGKQTACLLAAMSPEVGVTEDTASCPADVMPRWLADVTPTIDDAGSLDAWHSMVQRYANLAGDWHRLSDAAWERLRRLSIRIALAEVSNAPKNLVTQTLGYWEDPSDVSDEQWASLRLPIVALQKKTEDDAPSRLGNPNFLEENHDFQLRRHGLSAMMEAGRATPDVGSLWHRTTRSAGSDNHDWEQVADRMTNLIFDAMQVEIDQAKAAN